MISNEATSPASAAAVFDGVGAAQAELGRPLLIQEKDRGN